MTVYDNKQKPRLSIEPYDLEVILGTIFEIPCKATDHSDVQVYIIYTIIKFNGS